MTKSEKKQCSESCGCASAQEINKSETAQLTAEQNNQKPAEQDPTKFGDWQVNGRAIDF